MARLTAKQALFVEEYLKDLNATQAAIRAGYSEKGARVRGTELLTNRNIAKAIDSAKGERSERTKIDADYVLKRLVDIDEMDVADLLDDVGNIKPVAEWPKVWRTTISGFDLQELTNGDTESVMRKIKWPDKVRNLELLGKHVFIQAFKDRVGHEGDAVSEMAQLMAQISNGASK